VRVCVECGVQLMTAYRNYYEPSALQLKKLIQSGKLGKIEFAPELDAFAGAIRAKKSVDPDGRQGHRDMCILQAIYESAGNGKPVGVRCGIR